MAAKKGPPTPLVLVGVFGLVMVCVLIWAWGWQIFGNRMVSTGMVSTGSTGSKGILPSHTPFQPVTHTPVATGTNQPDPTAWPTFTPTEIPSETPRPTQTEWPTATETEIPTLTNTPLPSPTPTSLAQYLTDEYDKLALSRAKRNNVLAWLGTILLGALVLVISGAVLVALVRHWIVTWKASKRATTTQADIQKRVAPGFSDMEAQAINLLEDSIRAVGDETAKNTRQIPGHRDLAGWGFERWQRVTDTLVHLGLCYKQSGGKQPGTYFKSGSLWVWLYVADSGRLAEPGIVNHLPTPPE